MRISDMLDRSDGLRPIAAELGINETQAAYGAVALIPMILGGFKKQLRSAPEAWLALVERLGGSALLDDVLAATPTDVSRGNLVLGQIFGTKDVSRAVVQRAAEQTGLSADVLERMLPRLAMLVTGHMAKQQAEYDARPAAAGSPLGEVLGTLGSRIAAGADPIPDVAPGLLTMLDVAGDGNPLDDVLEMAGKATR